MKVEIKNVYNRYCELCKIKQEKDGLDYIRELDLFVCESCKKEYFDLLEAFNTKFVYERQTDESRN